ncbi:hypothetical protein [Accumulibacter sp.]|uniref:hypothetical protein n=1 Tax=Accumulibacter sp. TaxID=2053492 RepID=UPI00258F3DB7|nr:hypothetical protein [Accumulibacter sp.]MCM8580719.1 hypothetical protein [Accumulibacter sp.]MCM8622199.1 hypothetical protein [Accumulibacter sp.]
MNHFFTWVSVAVSSSFVVAALAAPNVPTMRFAAVRDGAVCVSVDNIALRCLSAANSKARLPVWSRDGSRIAYVDEASPGSALAWLVVIDQHGQVLSRLPIKSVDNGEVRSGMRFVEALEWVAADRLVVSGSINPSSTEYLVFDLLSGTVVGGYIDDAHGAAFSPDGQHVLTVNGAPHFTAPRSRAPALMLDEQPVVSDLDPDLTSAGKPSWSTDSRSFAMAARDAAGRMRMVLGKAASKTVRWDDLPFPVVETDRAPTVFWVGNELYIQRIVTAPRTAPSGKSQKGGPGARNEAVENFVLAVGTRGAAWKRVTEPVVAPAKAAAALRASAAATQRAASAQQDLDVWCSGCELDAVPRRNPTTPE